MAISRDATHPPTGILAITSLQWQSLAVFFGAGGVIMAASIWWLRASADDYAAQRLGGAGLLFGGMFLAFGVLAARNLIRVARNGQAALIAPPTALDTAVTDFSQALVGQKQHDTPAADGSADHAARQTL